MSAQTLQSKWVALLVPPGCTFACTSGDNWLPADICSIWAGRLHDTGTGL